MIVQFGSLRHDLDACANSVAIAPDSAQRDLQPTVRIGAAIYPEFSVSFQGGDDGVDPAVAVEVAKCATSVVCGCRVQKTCLGGVESLQFSRCAAQIAVNTVLGCFRNHFSASRDSCRKSVPAPQQDIPSIHRCRSHIQQRRSLPSECFAHPFRWISSLPQSLPCSVFLSTGNVARRSAQHRRCRRSRQLLREDRGSRAPFPRSHLPSCKSATWCWFPQIRPFLKFVPHVVE